MPAAVDEFILGAMPAPADPHFRDHFSGVAEEYATFRPRYPPALFAALAAQAPRRGTAWDCATGSGQAALGLATHFERVVATDASAAQLAAARRHPRVRYLDRKSTRLNSSHVEISYAVFCLKK